MRKLLALTSAAALAALAAGPAAASHRTGEKGPHNCLGSAARNPTLHPLGQVVVGVLLPMAHPFGREFVNDRASECAGLEPA